MKNQNLKIHIFEENDNTFSPYIIRTFKATLYTFLISSFIFGLFQSLRRNSFINGFSDGILFGVLLAIVLIPSLFIIDVISRIIYYLKHNKFDFRIRQERKLIISEDYKTVFNIFSDILKKNNKFKIEHEDINEGEIHATVQRSWKSFGEKIEFRMHKNSNNNEIVAILRSEPKIKATIFDYCKNLNNIDLILNQIKEEN
jgi:hypothetical protein